MIWKVLLQAGCDPLVESCGETTQIGLVSMTAHSGALNDWLLLVLLVVALVEGALLLDLYLKVGKVQADNAKDNTEGE